MGKPKVAVIGARGIGRHHAKWYYQAGCEVVAFAGTSPVSCAQVETVLKENFPFAGKGYWDVHQMLVECRPDLVSVSSPAKHHAEHTIAALRAGASVLCEKPFYWNPEERTEEQLVQGRRMLEAAEPPGILAVNLQMAAGVQQYRAVYEELRGAPLQNLDEFYLHMTPRPDRPPRPTEWYWNDLGPHALSLLIGLAPDCELIRDSIDVAMAEAGTEAHFNVKTGPGICPVTIKVTAPVEGQMVRQFGANGLVVDFAAKADESGEFRTFYIHEGKEWPFDDFMKMSIERFIAAAQGQGRPYVPAEAGYHNLQLQLEIFDRARLIN